MNQDETPREDSAEPLVPTDFGAPEPDSPAAYDPEGRPLYYSTPSDETPPAAEQNPTATPAAEQTASAPEPTAPAAATAAATVNDAAQQADHDRSVHDYPDIQFSPTEYVVIDVQRSAVGLVLIWLVALLVTALALAAAAILPSFLASINLDATAGTASLVALGVALLAVVGGFVTAWVYRANYFIVTNERVFQRLQHSPFSYRDQNLEMERVEDCSFRQDNIIQTLLDYGTIRLSTVGDEQTYRFNFVARPAEQFKIINAVVQAVDENGATHYRRQN